MEKLFSYGTLQEAHVQLAVFARTLTGTREVLVGYRLKPFTISDPQAITISGRAEHTILEKTGLNLDRIEGTAFDISENELALADGYEDVAYKRVRVRLGSGADAWAYVRA